MKSILLIGLLLVHCVANAGLEFRGGSVVLILSADPCSDQKVLRHIHDKHHAEFKAARLFYEGRWWSSCWIVRPLEVNGQPKDFVFSFDEEGAPLVPILKSRFRDNTT